MDDTVFSLLCKKDGHAILFAWAKNRLPLNSTFVKGSPAGEPFQSVEKVAERHFFEFLQVLPLASAPGRQNLQSTKTFGFSSVLTHMSSEPD
ncbi:MAG: hypothetical protein ACI4NU_02655 [Christensenellales bacterium]